MRMLILHVDYFSYAVTERGRSKVVEDFDPKLRERRVDEALLILASVEKQDESDPEGVSEKAVGEITKIAQQLKVSTVVLHPFAHLFGELSRPEIAIRTLMHAEEGLVKHGLRVVRTPFGWFSTLELRAKGHPLSRVARIVSVD